MRKQFWKAIGLRKLRQQIRKKSGPLNLVVGADGTQYPGWLHTDIHTHDILFEHQWAALFEQGTLNTVLAEHVWEHLTPAEGLRAAAHCWQFLRPGGRLRIAVPDGYHPDPEYIADVRPGGSGPGALDHKVLYTYQTLGSLLSEAGFAIKLLEYYDEGGEFHFQDWDPEDGMIVRSSRFDKRNLQVPLAYTSLIVDGIKQ